MNERSGGLFGAVGLPIENIQRLTEAVVFEFEGKQYEQHFFLVPTMQLFQSIHWLQTATDDEKRRAVYDGLLMLQQRIWDKWKQRCGTEEVDGEIPS